MELCHSAASQLALRCHVGCPSGLELEAWALIACAGFPGSSVALPVWFPYNSGGTGWGWGKNAVLIKSPKTWRPLQGSMVKVGMEQSR